MKRIKLDMIQTPSPCSVGWDSMTGNDRERFCTQCNHTVHNLSTMTRREAERLFANANGSVCARYTRRADGSVVTTDHIPNRQRITGASLRLATAAFTLLLAAGADGYAQTTQLPPKTKIEITTNQSNPETTQEKIQTVIVGNILDQFGAVVVGANITVQMNLSKSKLTATSDESGTFVVWSLVPGVYTLTVEARGFSPFAIHNLKLGIQDRAEITAALQIDPIKCEIIQVRYQPTVWMGTTTAILRRKSIWRQILDVVTYPYREGKKILKPTP